MKIEMGTQRPEHLQAHWEGQFEIFSHFEFVCGIPSVLQAVTTLKELRRRVPQRAGKDAELPAHRGGVPFAGVQA